VGQNTNSDGKLGLDLTRFAADLADLRDEYQGLYNEFGIFTDRARAQSYRHVLSMLHSATDGEHGQTLEEQATDAKASR
jgi:hypothetical protein